MSESMIEMICRKVNDSLPDVPKWADTDAGKRAECMDVVRKVVEAMRTPTDAVLAGIVGSPGYEGDEDHALQDWQAAIDAALSEPD